MADFVRRLVSGNKSRFRDHDLDVELDLAYITDRIIVMGYPAEGIEGFYRNRREDAKKFLESRHGNNFWVFNCCPIAENSYPSSVFDGRVSRYPFPDHHAPPLAVLPLATREIHAWLDGSPDRVAVLHCKGGKGRSGTMACAYLLSLDAGERPSESHSSRAVKQRAEAHAEVLMNAMPEDEAAAAMNPTDDNAGDDPIKGELSTTGTNTPADRNVFPRTASLAVNSLDRILDLHTSKRMKQPKSPVKKAKPGVSIPSQRRWLYYWSLLLAHQGPPGFWSIGTDIESQPAPRVCLTQIKVRMRELSGVKSNLLRAVNAVIGRTSLGKAPDMAENGHGQIWASLARYDDELVDLLEKWERTTRDESGNLARRRKDSERVDGGELANIFKDGKWDGVKMVRSFARLGTTGEDPIRREESEGGALSPQVLQPLTSDRWEDIRANIEHDTENDITSANNTTAFEEESMYDLNRSLDTTRRVILNANREVRFKLYMGRVFMCWFWLIPTFHMPHPCPAAKKAARIILTKKEVDFAIGIGASIVDVELCMEWCPEVADPLRSPNSRARSMSRAGEGEPAGLAATAQAAIAGDVEVKQAAED